MMRQIVTSCVALAVLCSICYGQKKPAANEAKRPAVAKEATDATTEKAAPPAKLFKDEPAAHALYKQMIKAMRKADTLSYVSHYAVEGKGGYKIGCVYRAWLKKPNYFRVESESDMAGKMPLPAEAGGLGGVLVGDGSLMWIYWPKGRYKYLWEEAEDFAKTRLTTYIKKSALPGGHSIGHEVGQLGSGISMPIIDPSTFHGYTDSLQPYLDGVRGLGSEKVGNDDCDKIEVSIMKHQRSWFLWLSKRDHLPRKMKQIIRVSFDIVMTEDWSSVIVNGDIPDKMFVWKLPKGWTQYKEPPLEISLLKVGTKAPEFDLASADGTRIRLSDYRGKVVWFYVWRAG
jgi:outer membrane lipoprotein-sorting protein